MVIFVTIQLEASNYLFHLANMISKFKIFEKWITFYCTISISIIAFHTVLTMSELSESTYCAVFTTNNDNNKSLFLESQERNIRLNQFTDFIVAAGEDLKIFIENDCLLTICGIGTFWDKNGACHSYIHLFNSANQNEKLQLKFIKEVLRNYIMSCTIFHFELILITN